jgi:hypothetical protein
MLAEAVRKGIPDKLVVTARHQNCLNCGGSLSDSSKEAWVLSIGNIHKCIIEEQECGACGSCTLDGAEYFVLRRGPFTSFTLGSFELCFSWQLLYEGVSDVAAGMHFFTRFQRMLLTYSSVGWAPTQLAVMQSLYRPLKGSTMDFVDLMDLPYQDVLACKCSEPLQHLAADGITVSCKRSMLHLEGGWLPQQPEEGAPLMQSRSGSPYHARFVLRNPVLRSLLHPLGSANGMTVQQRAALLQHCEENQETDVLLLAARWEDGLVLGGDASLLAVDWARPFLHDISSNSPAIALVTLADAALLDRWIEQIGAALAATNTQLAAAAMSEWSRGDDTQCHTSMPRFWLLMRHVQQYAAAQDKAPLCAAVTNIITQIVSVWSLNTPLLWPLFTGAFSISNCTYKTIHAAEMAKL